jgi:6-pyruvoyltetrahydropterin/6-carboxytetrahydropterin synthase
MRHIIDKSFSFCYGHRVHNQRLDTKFTESGEACLACRHLHGHEGLVKIFLEQDYSPEAGEISNVERTGMVTDFKHTGWFKNFLDDVLDHKLILDLKDPLLKEECSYLLDDDGEFSMELVHKMPEGYWVPDLTILKETLDGYVEKYNFDAAEAQAIFEKYEGMVFVDFVPTSENLAGWLLRVAKEKMEGPNGIPNIRVAAVEYWETPKSHCRVEA